MTREELLARGMNQCPLHIDFVVGSDTIDVFGVHADGVKALLLRAGEWTFEV